MFDSICAIDLETTGIYWNKDAPIQIAAIIFDRDMDIVDSFSEKIKTTHAISPDASAVHHIYARDLINCRSEKEVLTDFMVWLNANQPDALLTYNGKAFDIPMLKTRCELLKIPGAEILDITHYDAKEDVFKAKSVNLFDLKGLGRRWKLSLVAESLGINSEGAHDAYVDVTMLMKVWCKLDPIIFPERWQETNSLW